MAERSKVAQMAEAEAQRAEAEQPDDETTEDEEAEQTPAEPEPEPQPEPEPEPQGGLTPEQAEELERASTNYIKRVSKVFGADNVPPVCPTCEGLGFDLAGGGETPDFLHASDKDTCPECGGYGGVLSGSKVQGQDVVRCDRCKGAGYLVVRQVTVDDPEKVAPVVLALANGNADGEQAAALKPGDPGWEPWMGGNESAATP